jgi:hypothetical protein
VYSDSTDPVTCFSGKQTPLPHYHHWQTKLSHREPWHNANQECTRLQKFTGRLKSLDWLSLRYCTDMAVLDLVGGRTPAEATPWQNSELGLCEKVSSAQLGLGRQ